MRPPPRLGGGGLENNTINHDYGVAVPCKQMLTVCLVGSFVTRVNVASLVPALVGANVTVIRADAPGATVNVAGDSLNSLKLAPVIVGLDTVRFCPPVGAVFDTVMVLGVVVPLACE